MAGMREFITDMSGPFTVLLFSLTARTPVNGAQPGIQGNNLKPAINDGPNTSFN